MNRAPWYINISNYRFKHRSSKACKWVSACFDAAKPLSPTVVLFSGSYARFVPLKSSDLDVVIISNDYHRTAKIITAMQEQIKLDIFALNISPLDIRTFNALPISLATSLPFIRYIYGEIDIWKQTKLLFYEHLRLRKRELLESIRYDIYRPREARNPEHPLYWDIKIGYGSILEYQYLALLTNVFDDVYHKLFVLLEDCLEAYTFLVYYREFQQSRLFALDQQVLRFDHSVEDYFSIYLLKTYKEQIAKAYRRGFDLCMEDC